MKIVIIGGSAGGASCATRLRRLDEKAEIIILERGEYVSYANCGLPYYIGGEIREKRALSVQTPESLKVRFGLDVRTGHEAVEIRPGEKTVAVRRAADGSLYTERYDKLLLSTGAEPVRPPLPGIDDPRVFTLRSIPDTYRIDGFIKSHGPKRALVIGGGNIGLEMAENLISAGLEVTVAELADHVAGALDADMARDLEAYLRKRGVKLLLGNGVSAIEPAEAGLRVKLSDGGTDTDMVLLSIGVRPDTALAKSAGLSLNKRGAIIVDEYMTTSNPDIYAVGDATQCVSLVDGGPGYIALAGPANKQGRIAADNICGMKRAYRGTQGSAVLKLFDMTVGTTGLNEAGAKNAGFDYDKIYLLSASHAGYYPGGGQMSIKVLYEKPTGRILGAQLIGKAGVDKRLDVLAGAVRHEMTADGLAELELGYAPPYSSAKDPVNIAGFMIQNLRDGLVRQFHWQDVEPLLKEGAALVDVRTPAEYAAGHIGGAMNIPLDELRLRLDEMDKKKPAYLYCRSGQRSYFACRILAQEGYDAAHLAGGYRLYVPATTGETIIF